MFGNKSEPAVVPPRGNAALSDLTGSEFWLVNDAGYEVLGLVLGNCIYSMGALRGFLSGFKGNFKGEIREYSQLMYDAREIALRKMQAEADALGADTVVGVDLDIEYMHEGEWMEVTAVGTAVRRRGGIEGHGRGQVVINT